MKFLVAIISLLTSVIAFGQDQRAKEYLVKKADHFYTNAQYSVATELYREALEYDLENPEINWRIAEGYRNLFEYSEAEVYYRKLYYTHLDEYPEALYYYALMLKANGKYNEAINILGAYLNIDKVENIKISEQAQVELAGAMMAKEDTITKYKALSFLEPLNTIYNDFSPISSSGEALLLTSSRIFNKRQRVEDRYGEGYTDLFAFNKQGDEKINLPILDLVNTKFHEASGSFTGTADKFYFTRCGGKVSECQIFSIQRDGGKWGEPIILNENVNMPGFQAKQPAVSRGGDTLFFVSNRPGGKGKNDIWISITAEGENWGPALNLGPSVNTELNELSPSTTSLPNILLFSSEGHQSYGGFDIFMAKRLSGGDTLLSNLGKPFNSSRDDCYFSLADSNVYWSSNREGGVGNFDIYNSIVQSEVEFLSWISLTRSKAKRSESRPKMRKAISESGNFYTATADVMLEYDDLTYEQKKIIDELVANRMNEGEINKLASFQRLGSIEKNILIKIAHERWKKVKQEKLIYNTRYVLKTDEINAGDFIEGFLYDSMKKPLGTVTVQLKDENDELLKITRTNEEGKFRFTDIPQKNLFYIYTETSFAKGAETVTFSNIKVMEFKEEVKVNFDNIYFDFDHYSLRPEAKLALDELSAYLKTYPQVQVEIFAHTDSKGSEMYNKMLSKKRGLAVLDYLSGKGVETNSIALRPVGKTSPLAPNDNLLGRQLNRRVEFYINGATAPLKNQSRMFILKEKIVLSDLAYELNLNIEQLSRLNGLSTDAELRKFQPVRLFGEIKNNGMVYRPVNHPQ